MRRLRRVAELPHFRIYRDSEEIGTVAPPRRGHGDNPEPIFNGWFFRDTRVNPDGKPVYRVSAVRGKIESAKSKAAKVVKVEPAQPAPDLVVLPAKP